MPKNVSKKYTVLIVDDHPLIRQGLTIVLKQMGFIRKILEASDGKEALAIADSNSIDLFLIDFRMPGMDGYDLSRFLLQKDKAQKIIVISLYSDTPLILNLFKIGVKGFLMKNSDLEEIHLAIEKVLQGKFYYNKIFEPILGTALSKFSNKGTPRLKFNKSELKIIDLIAQGYTSKEISHRLKLTSKTIEVYRGRMFEKAGVKNTSELLSYFHKNGLL